MTTFMRAALAVGAMVLVVGCAEGWATSSVAAKPDAAARHRTAAEQILVVEGDITDRPYKSLGDVSVTVNKVTIFNADPTRELVNQRLRNEAAKLGADAIIQVRYGTVGITGMSWGSLDGKGRAVAFDNK